MTSHPSCMHPSMSRIYGLPKLIEFERMKSPLYTRYTFWDYFLHCMSYKLVIWTNIANFYPVNTIPICRKVCFYRSWWTSTLNGSVISQLSFYPLNPLRRVLPVRSCCIAPCLIFFLFSICLPREEIKLSMLVRAEAMRCCSWSGGNDTNMFEIFWDVKLGTPVAVLYEFQSILCVR